MVEMVPSRLDRVRDHTAREINAKIDEKIEENIEENILYYSKQSPRTITQRIKLFQHATQGWCPPLPLFRRMEKRTRNEIDVEKFAMKALRGDFDGFNRSQNPGNVERIIYAVSAYQSR